MTIDTVILSGGGIKGFYHVGAIKYLHEKDILKNIKTFIGTSIGSVIALMLSLNYTINEIEYLFINLELGNMYNINSDNIINFLNIYGIDDSENINNMIEIIIGSKYNKNITFKELYDTTDIELRILVTNLTDQKFEIFDHKSYPNTPVSIAIRMSCSVPVLYKPVEYNTKLYIDGGLTNNYPIDIVYHNNYLGFLIYSNYTININNAFDYIIALIYSITNKCDETYKINDKHNNQYNIKFISNCNPLDFSISKDLKLEMIKSGYEITLKHFNEYPDLLKKK